MAEPSPFTWFMVCIGGATTFACKSQGCLWSDWYIYSLEFSLLSIKLMNTLSENATTNHQQTDFI